MHSEQKVTIEGQDPLIWGIKNNSSIKIDGMSFVRYLQVYGIEKFSKLANLDERKELMTALIKEYDLLIHQKPVNKIEIKYLEEFYNNIYSIINTETREEKLALREREGRDVIRKEQGIDLKSREGSINLDRLLKGHTVTELVAVIKSNAKEKGDKLVDSPLDLIEKLPLKAAHKMWQIGKELGDTGVVQTIIEAITLAIIRIRDAVNLETTESSITQAIKKSSFQELVTQSKVQQDTGKTR